MISKKMEFACQMRGRCSDHFFIHKTPSQHRGLTGTYTHRGVSSFHVLIGPLDNMEKVEAIGGQSVEKRGAEWN